MGKLNPENADEWSVVEKYEIAGHEVEYRTGGYLHYAGFVDGELVVQDHDNVTWVKEETEAEAKYR